MKRRLFFGTALGAPLALGSGAPKAEPEPPLRTDPRKFVIGFPNATIASCERAEITLDTPLFPKSTRAFCPLHLAIPENDAQNMSIHNLRIGNRDLWPSDANLPAEIYSGPGYGPKLAPFSDHFYKVAPITLTVFNHWGSSRWFRCALIVALQFKA